MKKLIQEPTVEQPVSNDTINQVLIESLVDANFAYPGRVSGKQYEWHGAGSKALVDELDVPDLISKRLGTSLCCGATPNGNIISQIVGG